MQAMKKMVIFDLDGTLFDTATAMQICGNSALEALGLPTFSREDYTRFSGGGLEEYVNGILEAAGDKEHRHYEAFSRIYFQKNDSLGLEVNVPFPKVPEMLAELKKKGILLAVLSNKDHASCVRFVEAAFGTELFCSIQGNSGVFPPKPHPAGVEEILKQYSISKKECLYVGDTQVDIHTAKNAGVDCAAALWGYRPFEVLERENPEFLIESPMDIVSLL